MSRFLLYDFVRRGYYFAVGREPAPRPPGEPPDSSFGLIPIAVAGQNPCCCCLCCTVSGDVYTCDSDVRISTCAAGGGVSNCSESTCVANACCNGACCQGDSCSIKADVVCQALGGTFKGCGTTCAEGVCDEPCSCNGVNLSSCNIDRVVVTHRFSVEACGVDEFTHENTLNAASGWYALEPIDDPIHPEEPRLRCGAQLSCINGRWTIVAQLEGFYCPWICYPPMGITGFSRLVSLPGARNGAICCPGGSPEVAITNLCPQGDIISWYVSVSVVAV